MRQQVWQKVEVIQRVVDSHGGQSLTVRHLLVGTPKPLKYRRMSRRVALKVQQKLDLDHKSFPLMFLKFWRLFIFAAPLVLGHLIALEHLITPSLRAAFTKHCTALGIFAHDLQTNLLQLIT